MRPGPNRYGRLLRAGLSTAGMVTFSDHVLADRDPLSNPFRGAWLSPRTDVKCTSSPFCGEPDDVGHPPAPAHLLPTPARGRAGGRPTRFGAGRESVPDGGDASRR